MICRFRPCTEGVARLLDAVKLTAGGAAAQSGQTGRQQEYRTLYLRVARTGQKGEQKILPILKMFPGRLKTVIYYADTGVRLAGTCEPQEIMLQELRGLLGEENVVLK